MCRCAFCKRRGPSRAIRLGAAVSGAASGRPWAAAKPGSAVTGVTGQAPGGTGVCAGTLEHKLSERRCGPATGLDAFGGGPILLAMILHFSARRVLDGGAADWLLDLLRQALGSDIPAPTEIAVSSWGNDPWSGSAYSHIRPGGSAADADTLGMPVAGRLCFAGEHTQSAPRSRRRRLLQRSPRSQAPRTGRRAGRCTRVSPAQQLILWPSGWPDRVPVAWPIGR